MALVRRRSVIVLGLALLFVAGCGGGERVGPTEPSAFVDQPPATAIRLSGPVDSSSAGDLIGRFDPPSAVAAAHRIANPALVRPGPPSNLRAQVGISFVTLTWDAPTDGGPVSTYWIEVASRPNSDRADLANIDTRSANTAYSARAPNGTYYVRVLAENDAGKSKPSDEIPVIVGPCGTLPGEPLDLTHSVRENTVTLTWRAPPFGPLPTSYIVEASFLPGNPADRVIDTGSTLTSYPITAPNGTYYVRVRAKNGCGVGPRSNEIVVRVGPLERPGAPTLLTPSVDGALVTLTWRAPTSGGQPTAYIIEIGSAPKGADYVYRIDSRERSLTARLQAGTYYARVMAANDVGVSDPSNEVTFAIGIIGLPPGAPTNLTASIVDVGVVRLAWTAATSGGTPATYIVEIGSSPGASDVHITNTGSTATEISLRLSPGIYYARVKAANSFGTSPPSNEVRFVVSLPPGSLDGTWTGPTGQTFHTGQRGRVTFTVSGGSIRSLEFIGRIELSSVSCSWREFLVRSTVNQPIVNNAFAFRGRSELSGTRDISYEISGTFASATSSSGSLSMTSEFSGSCPPGTAQTTWTASK